MSVEFREVLQEVSSSTKAFNDLHPRRLDRWWTTLVAAPETIYMQLGITTVMQHVLLAASAIQQMKQLLGNQGLPVSPQEIARRRIKQFVWHVPSESSPEGTLLFTASWGDAGSVWLLTCSGSENTTRFVEDLEQAVAKATEWAAELEAELRENAVESE